MAGRITNGPSVTGMNDLLRESIVTATDGLPAMAVVNTDGSAISGGGGGGGLAVQDESAFTAGTSNFTPSGGVYNDSATALTSGQQGTERLTPNRATHTNLRNNSGTEIATASNPLRTDPTGTTTQPVSASSLPLPTGAAVAAKQPALGTAGSASADVISIQGIASMTAVKVDGSAVTQPVSGTVTSNIGTTGGLALDATLTGGTQQSRLTDGTNITNVLKSDGTAVGQNAQLVAGTYLSASWSVSSPAAVVSTDVGNYKWVSVHITAYTSGTINFQGSNDNSTWIGINLSQEGTANASTATSTTAAGLWSGPLNFRYFRLNITGGGSTNAGTVYFFTYGGSLATFGISASQSGTWTVGSNSATGSAVPANAFFMGLSDGTNLLAARTGIGSDNFASTSVLSATNQLYNGTNYDRYRNNQDNISLLASAARTTTQTVADQTNYNHKGVIVTLDVTNIGTGNITLEIDMKDPVSGKYVALLTGAAVSSNSTNIYTVYPGATVTANVSASSPLPRTWRVVVTANNANSVTYSVGASLIL